MFRSPILFVIGAGASHEVGLPTGEKLKDEIAYKLTVKKDENGFFFSGLNDHVILRAIQDYAQSNQMPGGVNSLINAATNIHDAISQADSIDAFIDAHRGNKYIEMVGKFAITRCILEAERKSKLFYDFKYKNNILFNEINDTWYSKFWRLLSNNIASSDIDQLLNNISFIVFNYDRCVEHFLYNSIRNYYTVDENKASGIMNKLKIYHPYGTVGELSWQIGNNIVDFGGDEYEGRRIIQLSQNIITYTQSIKDEEKLKAMHGALQEANTVVFLGFAFHEQNMKLLKPIPSNVNRVFATAKGLSDSDCEVIRKFVKENFSESLDEKNIFMRNKITCSELFNEYRRSLMQS